MGSKGTSKPKKTKQEVKENMASKEVKANSGSAEGKLEECQAELEKVKAEAQGALENAQLKVDYLNNLPTPVMSIDRDYNVNYMNPAGAQTVGKTVEQTIGMKCFELFKTPHCNTPVIRRWRRTASSLVRRLLIPMG